ncbi:MAG: ChbG/HpnK family deacetylase [Planctomycetota bacterium]|jgi:predicted glycoside hydrolase/deacetylase ChbG (UPF0249 family)|nr:ChbG/HpnK family deacetylase [Planctomycetota bacterium]
MTGRRLLVNADDLGLSRSVNDGVLLAHREGILTSASLLGNAPAFDDAVAKVRGTPRLGVGVHLNIVRGRPLSEAGDVPTLVDAGGAFRPFRFRMHTPAFLADAEHEYRLQMQKILDAGVRPAHLDFEKHHAWRKPLYALAVRLAAEYGIPRIRNLEEPVWWSLKTMGWPGARRTFLASAMRVGTTFLSGIGPPGKPDRLLGQLHIGGMDEIHWLRLLDRLPDGLSEVMVHPGLAGDEDAMGASWIDSAREMELRALVSPRVAEKIRELGIVLAYTRPTTV